MYANETYPTKCGYRQEEETQITTRKLKLKLVSKQIKCLLPCVEKCMRRRVHARTPVCVN